ncbi:hypothetical protein JHK85_039238 [Glycine max]|uniref:Uncharacterized protein n=1 Tax=Glycine soja TaxID=3848 RepID=A0A0B2QUT5_GLYSO|nr:hypothetical protein JHK85_039238 [Glycine max]KHN23809.1 hypothetical protein glysoja_028102 [Glycine soja]
MTSRYNLKEEEEKAAAASVLNLVFPAEEESKGTHIFSAVSENLESRRRRS